MKNKEKPEILIPRGYSPDEMLDLEGVCGMKSPSVWRR